jgi:hypothetical protein
VVGYDPFSVCFWIIWNACVSAVGALRSLWLSLNKIKTTESSFSTLIALSGVGTTCLHRVVIKIRQLLLRPCAFKILQSIVIRSKLKTNIIVRQIWKTVHVSFLTADIHIYLLPFRGVTCWRLCPIVCTWTNSTPGYCTVLSCFIFKVSRYDAAIGLWFFSEYETSQKILFLQQLNYIQKGLCGTSKSIKKERWFRV